MYCKFFDNRYERKKFIVLIVAKCIVNDKHLIVFVEDLEVLIVAKCIVNNSLLIQY